MPTTLTNGIQLPDKGSVDWYNSMQSNYNLIDTHLGDTDVHVTAEDKANWDSKQGSLSQAQLDAIAQVATNTSDIATLQTGKANASHTHSSSDITDIGDYATKQYVDNSISGLVDSAPNALDTLNELAAALNDDSNFASTVTNALATKANSADLATVATSGDYDDLSNKPTINDSTITIQKNGSTVDTFTTNGSAKTINIPVPTKTSDITNDSNFVDTSNSAVASGITSAKVTDYDTHIADTDIHVTTADKNKWNNQTYVFRYSSTALVASSTNSNTLLDNTDNLKVGDKVIDSNGVLFSVTAIDTANSTFTIGTALIDLAQDSDVVHKSGNETVDGLKTFSKYITSDGSVAGDEYSGNSKTNFWLLATRDTEEVSGVLFDTFRQNITQGTGNHILGIGIKENSVRYEGCRFSWSWDNNLNGYSFSFRPTLQGTNQAVKHNLGTSTDKWATINGINPGALSLPDLSNGIDISGFITLGTTNNTYTPPSDGWICMKGRSGSNSGFAIIQGDLAQSSYNLYDFNSSDRVSFCSLPVKAGVQVEIWLKQVTSLDSAKFYPCLGNV